MNSSIIDWLRSGGPWGAAPQVVETHAALVFLIGDRALKLKKAVNLGYLDFTTVDRRLAALKREFALNRRTAPALYLALVPIVVRDGAYALGGEGEIVDWLIEMRRFPGDALLAAMADSGVLDEAVVEKLAAHAAWFHDLADLAPKYDWQSAVARIARENEVDLSHLAGLLGLETVQDCINVIRARLNRSSASLARASSDVRLCHGDLHLANAFLDNGDPRLFDCIEFDDFYATIPPLYDIAFLIMDLNARGLRRYANRALNAWIINRAPHRWGDVLENLNLTPLYVALRAEIRAKVEARRPGGAESARRYLDLAR
ncbi:MAG: phosphotransferase, partial [Parvularculaceae bacterium]